MITLKKHAIGGAVGLALMMMMNLGSFSNAFADSPPAVEVNLTAGALTETSGNIAWTGAVNSLNGAVQDAVYSFPITVTDATGSAAGWHLTITSTRFTGTSNSSHLLPATASEISAVDIANIAGTIPVASTPAITPLMLPTSSTVPFFSAEAGSGMGSSTITPTIHIAIPAETIPDDYKSTLTVASVGAP